MSGHPSIAAHPDLDQWIELSDDDRVLLHTGKVELGQRLSTALAMIAAEELDVDYERIDIKSTETDIDPNEGFTAGSMSMIHSGNAIRKAGATARRHMLRLAGERFGVDPSELTVDDGLIQSRKTNQSVTYWELMGGHDFGIPVDEAAEPKAPESHRIVGTAVAPKGMSEIVSGQYAYIHDMDMAGMLHARIIRPPHYFAELAGLDETLAGQLQDGGVTLVRNGSFLAVAADDEYAAVKAALRVAAEADWDLKDGIPSKDLFSSLTSNAAVSLPVVTGGAPVDEPVPPLADPPADAAVTLSARYEKPYIMHGSIGPSAGCALYEDDRLRVWTHNQGVYPLRAAIAQALGLDKEAVTVSHVVGAGCYGHNGADDAAFDAALIAMAIPGRPILLKWTREDEHAWEPYGTAMVSEIRASLDGHGQVIDWSHETYGDTFMCRPAPARTDNPAELLLSARYTEDPSPWPVVPPTMGAHVGIHRNLEPLYTFPEPRLVKNLVRGLPLRVSALRTLGAFANVVAIESFVDELAAASGRSPFEFRLAHLEDERARAVIKALDRAMQNDDAGTAEDVGAGIGFSRYKNSAAYCAVGIEVEVDEKAQALLRRAWITADAGEVVDPAGLTAQLEGGLIQAASWTLYEKVTWDSGGITSRDWETYPILKFSNVPAIETILIDRPGEPFLGAGEAVAGPAGGAISNAIYHATGLRLRRMPFDPDTVKSAAMQ